MSRLSHLPRSHDFNRAASMIESVVFTFSVVVVNVTVLNQDIVSGNFITGTVEHDVLKCCYWKWNDVCDLSLVGDSAFRNTETKRHKLITKQIT